MPWVDVEDAPDHNAEYVLNLTVPSDKAASDAGMWMTAPGDDAFFAAANGIKGTIRMQQTGMVNVEIKKGVFDDVATRTEAVATLTGTGVPLGLVRNFATVMSVLNSDADQLPSWHSIGSRPETRDFQQRRTLEKCEPGLAVQSSAARHK
jgi:hypothetical protein